jgi:hypothetical protein
MQMMTTQQRGILAAFMAGPSDATMSDEVVGAYVQECRDEHKATRRDHETAVGRARYLRAVTVWLRRYRIRSAEVRQ